MIRSKQNPMDVKLRDEINVLKARINDAEEQLKEEQKIKLKLRNDAEKKLQQMSILDEQIEEEEYNHSNLKRHKENEIEKLRQQHNSNMSALLKQQIQFESDIAGFDVLESENKQLHEKFKALSKQYAQASMERSSQREARKQKSFDTRMKMDEILRNTIKECDEDYQRDAILMMDEQAALAREENNELQAELKDQGYECQTLIKQQQQSYEKLMKIRLEHEVVVTSGTTQEVHAINLEKIAHKQESKLQKLSTKAEHLQAAVEQMRILWERKMARTAELEAASREIGKIKSEIESTRNRVVNLAQHLIRKSLDQTVMNSKKLKKKKVLNGEFHDHTRNILSTNKSQNTFRLKEKTEIESSEKMKDFDDVRGDVDIDYENIWSSSRKGVSTHHTVRPGNLYQCR